MTCATAFFSDFVSARPDQTIEDALHLLREHGIRALPVVDGEGFMVGRFDFIVLLSNLLPGSVTVDMRGTGFEELMDHNLKLASVLNGESEVKCAQRLEALLPVRLEDVMDTEVTTVYPTTPLWEGIRLLVQHRGPLGVVDKESGKLVGLITVQSAMRALARMSARF